MRNDSAAAIALNRSGFLGGSLDWDFDGEGRVSNETEHTASKNKSDTTLPPVTATYSISANNHNLNQSDRPTILASDSSSKNPPPTTSGDSTNPESPDYMVPNDVIVVYNERTAL